jgi:hypothetical protein
MLVCETSTTTKQGCLQRAQNKNKHKAALTALSACLLCLVPATSACFSEFLGQPLTELTRQTRQAVHSIKQTIFSYVVYELNQIKIILSNS